MNYSTKNITALLERPDFMDFLRKFNISVESFANLAENICDKVHMGDGTDLFNQFQSVIDSSTVERKVNWHTNTVNLVRDELLIESTFVSSISSKFSSKSSIKEKRFNKIIFYVVKHDNRRKPPYRWSLRADCIRKKIKSIFSKHLIASLNKQVACESNGTCFRPLPLPLSHCLNLKENKLWINMSLRNLMTCNKLPKTETDKANQQHNLASLQQVSSQSINSFLDNSWRMLYFEYIKSSEFEKAMNDFMNINPLYAHKMTIFANELLNFFEH